MAKQQLNEGVADLLFTYQFLKRLTTPFKETKAFELGIIDEDGKVLKKAKQLTTSEEKKAYGYFDRLVFGLKRLLEKVPGGKSKFASYAAALYLIKECANPKEHYSQEELAEGLLENLTMLEKNSTKKFHDLTEKFDVYVSALGDPHTDDVAFFKKSLKTYKGKQTAHTEDGAVISFSNGRAADNFKHAINKLSPKKSMHAEEAMHEDAPANATGAAVVGTGDDPVHWADKKRKVDFRFKEMKAVLRRYQEGKMKREALKTKKDFKNKLGIK
jgi:hypothetical protein